MNHVCSKLETMTAFKREIHEEELWLYKNPRRPDFVRGGELLFWVIVAPFLVTLAFYWFTKDRRDFRAASWAWTLGLCMNGIPTSLLKITVGRPRPDYFYRCFPDGVMVLNTTSSSLDTSILDFNCTGLPGDINEGRKSFPSGHSSCKLTRTLVFECLANNFNSLFQSPLQVSVLSPIMWAPSYTPLTSGDVVTPGGSASL